MNEQIKLERAMNHLQIVIDLVDGNEYKQYFLSQFISSQIELKRKFKNTQFFTKIDKILS